MDLQEQINKLNEKIKQLENSTTISKEVENAFNDRFRFVEFVKLSPSTKTANSESQSVNEAGVATYSVLKNPDGWEQREVSGVIRYYPYWN